MAASSTAVTTASSVAGTNQAFVIDANGTNWVADGTPIDPDSTQIYISEDSIVSTASGLYQVTVGTASLSVSPTGCSLTVDGIEQPLGGTASSSAVAEFLTESDVAAGPTQVSPDWTPRQFNNLYQAGPKSVVSMVDEGQSFSFCEAGSVRVNAFSKYYNSNPAAVAVSALLVWDDGTTLSAVYPGTSVFGSGTSQISAIISAGASTKIQLAYKSTGADPEGLGYAAGFVGVSNLHASIQFSVI